ncbi:MAG: hypothetical protein JNJ44_03720 [Zoogloeaceae bacterium]|nr:hypothetical protein [Zoogloeaceae bacterium]
MTGVRVLRGLRWLTLTGLLLPLALLGLVLSIPESEPLVAAESPPTPAAVARARMLLRIHDPRLMPPGQPREIRLAQPEMDLALAALPQLIPPGRTLRPPRVSLRLGPTSADLAMTWRLPANPVGTFVNLRTTLVNGPDGLAPRRTRLGPLPLPDALASLVVHQVVSNVHGHPEWGPLTSAVESLQVERRRLLVRYQVPEDLAMRLGGLALGSVEAAALEPLHAALANALGGSPRSVSLAALLPPLFKVVAGQEEHGLEARRGVFLLLGSHLAGQSLARIVPEAATWTPLPRRTVTLAGRVDSAQHFAVSALIALHAGTPVAQAVGVWKELADSRGGSGFSFADLAADAAGTRLGQALAAEGQLVDRLASGLAESDIIPAITDLPEHLPAADFRARYGGTEDPRYQSLTAEIERRVAALPLYR